MARLFKSAGSTRLYPSRIPRTASLLVRPQFNRLGLAEQNPLPNRVQFCRLGLVWQRLRPYRLQPSLLALTGQHLRPPKLRSRPQVRLLCLAGIYLLRRQTLRVRTGLHLWHTTPHTALWMRILSMVEIYLRYNRIRVIPHLCFLGR